jgi:cytochrome d ubiquinol oxidase subunit II
MLLGLIFRGVAFEFRFKTSEKYRYLWDYAFHFGSLVAAFMQGMILGGFVQGINVSERSFAGGPLDWLSAFSVTTGLAVVCGYILLGATWLIMKTDDHTQKWATNVALYSMLFIGFFMFIVSLSTAYMDERIAKLWFHLPNYLLLLPLLASVIYFWLWRELLKRQNEVRPFFLSLILFLLAYLGLGISIWPWMIPYSITAATAAAAPSSQSLLLVGAGIFLPLIIFYTCYSYYVFKGKSTHEEHY